MHRDLLSGISGLSTAYHLIKYSANIEVHLIEKNEIIGMASD
jgi:L-2-hydroxyglutarate oxidase LhgO